MRHDFHGHDALVVLRLADGTEILARVFGNTRPPQVGERIGVAVRGVARAFPS